MPRLPSALGLSRGQSENASTDAISQVELAERGEPQPADLSQPLHAEQLRRRVDVTTVQGKVRRVFASTCPTMIARTAEKKAISPPCRWGDPQQAARGNPESTLLAVLSHHMRDGVPPTSEALHR